MKAVYTDIDSILDTRAVMLAILTNYGKYKIGDVIYSDRVKDNFGTIPASIFNLYYKNRTKSLLNHAKPTRVPELILDYLSDTIEITEDRIDPTIYINVYPYKLSAEELETFTVVFMKIFPNINIKLIDTSLEELDPKWIKKHIGLFVSYTGVKWLERFANSNSFIDTSLINVIFITPLLIEGTMNTLEYDDETFDRVSEMLSIFCFHKYVPVYIFNHRN